MEKKVLVNIGQLIILNILYILVVLISFGILFMPATSSFFYSIRRIRSGSHDPYNFYKKFFKDIFTNIKRLKIMQISFMFIAFFSIYNMINIDKLPYPVILVNILFWMYFIIVVEILFISLVASYLNANYKFEKELDILKMSVYIIHRHIVTTLIILVLITLLSFYIYQFTAFILFLGVFSLLYYFMDFLYSKLCTKYLLNAD